MPLNSTLGAFILGSPYSFNVTLFTCDNPPIPPSLAYLPTHLATHLLACNMAIYNGLHNVGFGVYVAKTQISLVVFFFFFSMQVIFKVENFLQCVMCCHCND
jgi:hypothetical protein